jgi:hypothetical protein
MERKEGGPISQALGKALYIALLVLIYVAVVHFLPYHQLHFIEDFVMKLVDKIHP